MTGSLRQRGRDTWELRVYASTTLNVYGHCVPGADRDAADYIAALLNSR